MQHVIKRVIKDAHRTGILLGKLCSHSTKTVEDRKFVHGICFLMNLRRKGSCTYLRKNVVPSEFWDALVHKDEKGNGGQVMES